MRPDYDFRRETSCTLEEMTVPFKAGTSDKDLHFLLFAIGA